MSSLPANRTRATTVPAVVRSKALAAGAEGWPAELPALIADLEREWSITVGDPFTEGTEAYVAAATQADGTPAVLKLVIPRAGDAAANEITALRLAAGDGCVRLLRADAARGALLLERLGRPLVDLGVPIVRRHEILVATAARVWRPAPGCGLPSGADKGRWLVDHVTKAWAALDGPCSERALEHAVACAERRIAAHDDERAVLVHGDIHQWNALEAPDTGGFKLVDPDGLLADAAYDLGVIMREDPLEHMAGDPHERSRWLARRTGLDETAIWEWGVVERVSTGLLGTAVGLQPVAGQMLAAADAIAASRPDRPRHPSVEGHPSVGGRDSAPSTLRRGSAQLRHDLGGEPLQLLGVVGQWVEQHQLGAGVDHVTHPGSDGLWRAGHGHRRQVGHAEVRRTAAAAPPPSAAERGPGRRRR